MTADIKKQAGVIEQAIEWARTFGKETFPTEELKEIRREVRRIGAALEENCSAAAYGESQVGKSYLMSSLLSTPECPFVINLGGHDYSFIDKINPSGGNTSKTESTGVITRFTIRSHNDAMSRFVRIKALTVADIVMLLADAYYNDLKADARNVLQSADIDRELDNLRHLWLGKPAPVQTFLGEDDVKDICDYIADTIGSAATGITRSSFRTQVAAAAPFLGVDELPAVFALLWNKNAEMTHLFATLTSAAATLGFETDVYVPFETVLRDKGTLLKIEWLDKVCSAGADSGNSNGNSTDGEEATTDVYAADGRVLAKAFSKPYLSALTAELTFVLPRKLAAERRFLEKIDLLDFPGARSREKFKEQEISSVLPTILRRGKVAYLFNKYSRSLSISAVLFSHHNDQKNEPSLGETINSWIEQNIGRTPEQRTRQLERTNGVSPLFFVATKFNIELERTKNDTPDNAARLAEHWRRFETVFPEIIKPATWFDHWVVPGGAFTSEAFRSIYPLRDFYWSGKNGVFDGYSDGAVTSPETAVHRHPDYPDYFENLRRSFLSHDFVRRHFASPEAAWDGVATVNNDGSKAIIRDLDAISGRLDDARRERHTERLRTLCRRTEAKLAVYYEDEDNVKKNERIRRVIGDIRRSLDFSVGKHPEIFGRIIDSLMLPVGDIRRLAYDIVILKKETPKDLNEIMLIRTMAGIESDTDRATALERLLDYYACDEDTLREEFGEKGFTIDDVLRNDCNIATTVADIVALRTLEHWTAFINKQVREVEQYLPHSDEVAFMLQTLCKRLGVEHVIAEKTDAYSRTFSEADLPNAIADFATLTLNNFVSTVGRLYLAPADISQVAEKAAACGIRVDVANGESTKKREAADVIEALKAFDDAADSAAVSFATLRKLPFWSNFRSWENNLTIGLLLAADVAHCDPAANKAIKEIIDLNASLYQ